ncbi:MAG: hypothetical protein ACYCOR_20960 [Acidobacteriaceae bacterium]
MNAEQIARKTLAPGEGHYAALAPDEIYSLCRAVLDAAEYRKRVEAVASEISRSVGSTRTMRERMQSWAAQLSENRDGSK